MEYYLGTNKEVFDAEIFAINEALEISTTPNKGKWTKRLLSS
jgi:hypothetical protein